MCLIVAFKSQAGISSFFEQLIPAAALQNPDGFGVGWSGPKYNYYYKTLKPIRAVVYDRLIRLATRAEGWVVMHFRQATSGGVSERLCHPFVVCDKPETAIVGKTQRPLLFHNGHWRGWDPTAVSDTAALARFYARTGYIPASAGSVLILNRGTVDLFGGFYVRVFAGVEVLFSNLQLYYPRRRWY